ncbi:uncharacterized protein LOC129239508 [Anastrepha obliqua]|uniref:uncharacterized protein LOC129239508 n=1 Tax=Anastrepha obliqua TaxID=95512 RepID=UPI0024095CE6|nr:uncharacterized protein LOC129239508 [Anastrepha obliqua]
MPPPDPPKIQRLPFKDASLNKEEIFSFAAQKFEEMTKTFQEEHSILRAQLIAVEQALDKQKVVIRQIQRQQAEELPLHINFPINSEQELVKLNAEINDNNRNSYIKTMRIILQPGVLKSMNCILTDQLAMEFNVDGVQGKKSLKSFNKFYGALLESIEVSDTLGSAESQLREAIKLQKKRHFRNLAFKNK